MLELKLENNTNCIYAHFEAWQYRDNLARNKPRRERNPKSEAPNPKQIQRAKHDSNEK
jgi:hypothetical protein